MAESYTKLFYCTDEELRVAEMLKVPNLDGKAKTLQESTLTEVVVGRKVKMQYPNPYIMKRLLDNCNKLKGEHCKEYEKFYWNSISEAYRNCVSRCILDVDKNRCANECVMSHKNLVEPRIKSSIQEMGAMLPEAIRLHVKGKDIIYRGNFNISSETSNKYLQTNLNASQELRKTGTTICGIIYKDGVILGSDTRATANKIVAIKNCYKIEKLSDNIACAGSGTSADCAAVIRLVKSNLKLLSLTTRSIPRVAAGKTMMMQHLYKYQGHISAYMIMGGADCTGSYLYNLSAYGSALKVPFITDGSGSLAAMSVLESNYKDDMNEKEAIDLVVESIKSGIYNDLGSGSNVDIWVIKKDGTKQYRNFCKLDDKIFKKKSPIVIKKGATKVIGEIIEKI